MKTRMKTGMKSDANWWCMHVAGMRTGMKSDANYGVWFMQCMHVTGMRTGLAGMRTGMIAEFEKMFHKTTRSKTGQRAQDTYAEVSSWNRDDSSYL